MATIPQQPTVVIVEIMTEKIGKMEVLVESGTIIRTKSPQEKAKRRSILMKAGQISLTQIYKDSD